MTIFVEGLYLIKSCPLDCSSLYFIFFLFIFLSTLFDIRMIGDWVSWSVRTKVMSTEQVKATMAMLTEASMDR